MQHTSPTDADYRDTLAALYARSAGAGIKLDLRCMQALLHAMGTPEQALRCVVVAGTNGKGSTSALIAAALAEAGLRVGLYTSPHLLRFTERIRVDGAEVSRADVVALAAVVRACEGRCPREPTFFECVTAMALRHFADHAVDVAVLEVGLGGRLDATNVVPRILSVITPVGLDHQAFLGDTLAAIAGEKAGIIVPQVPVVVAPQEAEAMDVIAARAAAVGAPVISVDATEASGHAEAVGAAGAGRQGAQNGAWQPAFLRRNGATAQRACEALRMCPPDAFARALASFSWPGRYHFVDGAPPVIMDGAHNPAGCVALREALTDDPRVRGRAVHAVFSAVHGKDAQAMLACIGPALSALHLCPVGSGRARTDAALRELAPEATLHPDIDAALDAARRGAGQDGVVLVFGSLFLVADALAVLTGAPRVPPVDG